MSKEIKVTLLGAGSLVFTSALLKGFLTSDLLKKCRVTVDLMDIDEEALNQMYVVGLKLAEAMKSGRRWRTLR